MEVCLPQKWHNTQYEVMADLHTDGQNAGWVERQEINNRKNLCRKRYHMDVWATSNGRAGLRAEVLFDITSKAEWRSNLDSVRCVKQIYSRVLDVNCRECQNRIEFTKSDRQAGGETVSEGSVDDLYRKRRKSLTLQVVNHRQHSACLDRNYYMLQDHWKSRRVEKKQDLCGYRRGL